MILSLLEGLRRPSSMTACYIVSSESSEIRMQFEQCCSNEVIKEPTISAKVSK